MVRIITLLLCFIAASIQAQVKTLDYKAAPVGTSNIRELNNKIDTIRVIRVAPKPYSSNDFEVKKAILNKQREAYIKKRKIDRRVDKDTSTPSEQYAPFVQGGFTDSLFTTSVPNDNHLCVGNNGDIISVLNSTIRVYKGDQTDLSYNVGLSYFGRVEPKNNWPNGKQPQTGSYDPKALYDPVNDRFSVIWLDGRVSTDTRIMFAVSNSNDAAGSYAIFHLEGNPLTDASWTDYPIISQDKNSIYITVNLLKDNGSWQEAFKQSIIWKIDKSKLYASAPVFDSKIYYNIKHNNKSIWSICPVDKASDLCSPISDQHADQTDGLMHFLSVRPSATSNDTLFLHTINSQNEYSYQILRTQSNYGLAGSAYQPQANFRLQTNDARILTAIDYFGTIQYAHNCINFETTAPSIMHGIIQKSNDQNWWVKNTLITSDSMDFGYPSMAYMGNGSYDHTAVLTFSHSSKTVYPGVSAVKIENDQTIGSIQRIKTGDDIINSFVADTMERWGDYSGTQRLYNSSDIVYLSNSLGTQGKPTSGTYIGRLRFDEKKSKFTDETNIIFPNPSGNGLYYLKLNTLEDLKTDYYTVKLCEIGSSKIIYNKNLPIDYCGNLIVKFDFSFLSNGTYALYVTKNNDSQEDNILLKEKIIKY